jgi:peroxin-2
MNRQMVWHAFTVGVTCPYASYAYLPELSSKEFLLFLLPLIPARSIRGRLARLSSYTLESLASHPIFSGIREDHFKSLQGKNKKRGKYWSLPLDQCAICAENASFSLSITDSNTTSVSEPSPSSTSTTPQQDSTGSEGEPPAYPLYTPYRASCGDVYCYHCIVECMMRVADEGEEAWECLRCGEGVRQADRFIVDSASDVSGSGDSDVDFTDLSGSVESYSNSGLSENGN